ncbi:MAG: nucleotidyltransferase family protein, partial [Clostridia bacterium]|nr:nucleotidyltransferase family protein [Clostridia bacterium]
SAIREALSQGETPSTLHPAVLHDLGQVSSNDVLYLAAWRGMSKEQAATLWGAEEGLQNRVWDCMAKASTYQEALSMAATKRYTTSRLKRLATAGLLGLTQEMWREGDALPPYYNVLALKEDRKDLLAMLSRHGEVYTSHLDLAESNHPFARLDAKADEVFELLRSLKMPTHFSLVK